MPSTYSTSLKLQLIGTGEQAGVWGTTTNYNLGTLLEQAITGVINISMGDATYTLTNFNGLSDEARNAVLILNGPITSPQFLVAPAGQQKVYIVRNRTGNTVTLTTGTGSNISVANAASEVLFTDGANVYSATQFNYINGDLTVTGNATIGGSVSMATTANSNVIIGAVNIFANSSTGQVYLPAGDANLRTASPINGVLRYNTTLQAYEGYQNNVWVRFQTFPQGNYTIAYLVVAGGGGSKNGISASADAGGGSGAGGVLNDNWTATPGIQTAIIVGAGGGQGSQGSTSSIANVASCSGGGFGGGNTDAPYSNAGSGGSGGGGGWITGAAGAGTAGQGFAGGAPLCGGGGAGAIGGSSSGLSGGAAGGIGRYVTITGAGVYYGGGGGGGGYGAGGAGGGGRGGFGNPRDSGTNGTANTGGGGGSCGGYDSSGGSGGSGIVILRIPTSSYTGTTTGSPTVTTDGAFTVLTYLSSGSYTT
jgi:hypothetical protein